MDKHKFGFTILELMIVITIIAIITGGAYALFGNFNDRRMLESTTFKLVQDLQQAQQWARARRNGFENYGVKLYNTKYKINLYCITDNNQQCLINPIIPYDFDLVSCYRTSTVSCNYIKVSENEPHLPEIIEDTDFPEGIGIFSSSERRSNDVILFTPEGLATIDGSDPLPVNEDSITLQKGNLCQCISITGMTGYARVGSISACPSVCP